MRAPLTFTLVDIEGNPHEYLVPLFRTEEGVKLLGRLMGCLGGPLAGIAGAAAAAFAAEGSLSAVISREVASLDTDAVANQLRITFLSGAPADLLLDLVRGATRDSKPLSQPLAIDDAYAGNYLELVQAAWKVVQGNGLLPLSSISSMVSRLDPAAATTSTATPPAPAG